MQSALTSMGIAGFASGTPYVPHDMLAMVHEGEKITPRDQNIRGGNMRSGGPAIQIGEIHMHGATQDLVDNVADSMIKGARRAGANI
jgi:hypothetical protein